MKRRSFLAALGLAPVAAVTAKAVEKPSPINLDAEIGEAVAQPFVYENDQLRLSPMAQAQVRAQADIELAQAIRRLQRRGII